MKQAFSSAWELFKKDVKEYKWTVLAIVLCWALMSLLLGTPCILVLLFGIPCPFCGTTRAMWYAIQFRFADAFTLQPLWPLVPIAFLLGILTRYFKKLSFRWFVTLCTIFFCFFVLFYVYRMITQFPGTGSMEYVTPNLLFIIKNIIKNIQI